MTMKEMVYEVWELVRRNIVDDDEIDYRLIKKLILDQRELWLSNAFNKGELSPQTGAGGTGSTTNPERYKQVIVSDMGEILCPGDKTFCMDNLHISKSSEPFPNVINYKGKPALLRITKCDCPVQVSIDFTSVTRGTYVGNGRWNSKQMYAFLYDDYLYLSSKDQDAIQDTTKLCTDAILADPSEFIDDDEEFPIDGKNWEYMLPEIIKKLRLKIGSLEDKENDAQDQELNYRNEKS